MTDNDSIMLCFIVKKAICLFRLLFFPAAYNAENPLITCITIIELGCK